MKCPRAFGYSSMRNHKWPIILVASVLSAYLAMMFWLGGFKYADASVASVLNETSNIFIVLLAALFLKEKISAIEVVWSGDRLYRCVDIY